MITLLTYPLALLALAALPALAAIYILRHKFRRRQVSSLMLWQFQVQSKAGGAKIHRLQLPLVFFLELLALLLLVTAAAGPRWNIPQTTRPMIVVLDDSLSMRAGGDARSPRAKAIEFLERSFKARPPPSIRLLLAGKETRVLGAPVQSWAEARELLDQWSCWSAQSSIQRAITLASELGNQQANILVLTDHPPENRAITGSRLEWRAFGAPLDNLAFVNASRSAHGGQDRCLLEIANFSPSAREALVRVASETNAVQTVSVTIGARERQRLVFNIPAGSNLLSAAIEDDAFPEDNTVRLLPPVRKRVRVQVAVTNQALGDLIVRTLDATGLRAAISENPELIIHQSPGQPGGPDAWSLRWIASGEMSAYTGPFLIDPSHPLAHGVTLHGAVWAASSATNMAGSVPVIMAGNIPLLSAREDALGRRHLTLDLDPALSTVHNTPDWPILFWNLLHWRASQTPGLPENNFRIGADVTLQTTGEPLRLTLPDGMLKSFAPPSGSLVVETPIPGLYSVAMGAAELPFSVNPLAAEESDLSARATGKWGEWQDEDLRRYEYASVLWIFILGALAVMVCHLVMIARGKGGA
jgi:hypothetical protein